ncbi:L-lactate permease [Shigella flexneri]
MWWRGLACYRAVPQLPNFLGPELPDIISSLVSLVSLTLFLKHWQPVRIPLW